jgi:hypothetical protein
MLIFLPMLSYKNEQWGLCIDNFSDGEQKIAEISLEFAKMSDSPVYGGFLNRPQEPKLIGDLNLYPYLQCGRSHVFRVQFLGTPRFTSMQWPA